MTSAGTRPGVTGTAPNLVRQTTHQTTSTKTCPTCCTAKPFEAFAIDRTRRGGRRSICAECRADYDCLTHYRRRCRAHGVDQVVKPFTRRQLIELKGDRCFYCADGAFEHIDHVIPVAAGGHHVIENVAPSCASCNGRKGQGPDLSKIRDYRLLNAIAGVS